MKWLANTFFLMLKHIRIHCRTAKRTFISMLYNTQHGHIIGMKYSACMLALKLLTGWCITFSFWSYSYFLKSQILNMIPCLSRNWDHVTRQFSPTTSLFLFFSVRPTKFPPSLTSHQCLIKFFSTKKTTPFWVKE